MAWDFDNRTEWGCLSDDGFSVSASFGPDLSAPSTGRGEITSSTPSSAIRSCVMASPRVSDIPTVVCDQESRISFIECGPLDNAGFRVAVVEIPAAVKLGD